MDFLLQEQNSHIESEKSMGEHLPHAASSLQKFPAIPTYTHWPPNPSPLLAGSIFSQAQQSKVNDGIIDFDMSGFRY